MENTKVQEKPKFVTPTSVLREVNLKAGDTVLDYGASSGHWAIPAALIVGSKGKVYAVDDKIEILNLLKSNGSYRNLKNIEIQELNLEKTEPRLDGKADLIIIANILHLIEDKESFIKKAFSLLKEDGKILMVDWCTGKFLFGPPEELRLKEEKVISLFEEVGLRFVCIVDAGHHHFGLVFDKGHTHAKRKESFRKE